MPRQLDFRAPSLGEGTIPSPLRGIRFVRESEAFSTTATSIASRRCSRPGTSREVSKRADRESAVVERTQIDPEGSLWSSVLASTGQPHGLTWVRLREELALPTNAAVR
jgi:hypothetical protein